MGSRLRNVTIVSVCYNSSLVVRRLLKTVPIGVSTVLVDNASGDIAVTRQVAKTHGAELIELSDNIGFGRACNIAAKRVPTEFLLFLNPDCLLEPDALLHLLAAAAEYPNAVAFNPALQGANGRSYFKRGSVLLARNRWHARGAPRHDKSVPVLSGAALFVRRSAFEEVEGFDPAIFLYHEDDDLSLRLARLGDLMFIRNAVVRHDAGSSSPRTPSIAALKAWHMGRSRVYASRKHGLALPFARPLLQAMAQACAPDIVFSARKRAKQIAFLRGVLSMRPSRGRHP